MSFVDGENTFLSTFLRFVTLIATSMYAECVSPDFALLSVKRVAVLTVLGVAFPTLLTWNHVGMWLDDWLFPHWRTCSVKDPLFIVGNARSGTTLMHRLLALNEDQFTFFRTWEILVGVSVTWRLLFLLLARMDELVGGPAALLLDVMECCTVRGIRVHTIGLQLAEEDEWLMMWICKAQLLMMPFPLAGTQLGSLVLFDEQVAPETRAGIMGFYSDCVQRHVYARALWTGQRRRTFVSKNPPFTLRIASLRRAFPSCRVACMLRDPVESVPSMVSYIAQTWRAFACPLIQYPRFQDLVGFCMAHYTHPIGKLPQRYVPADYVPDKPHGNSGNGSGSGSSSGSGSGKGGGEGGGEGEGGDWGCFVEYSQLRARLGSTVLEVLQTLGYSTTDTSAQYKALLQVEEQLSKDYSNGHSYSLQQTCDVSDDVFKHMFADIYRAHFF